MTAPTRRGWLRRRQIGAATLRFLREDQQQGGFKITGTVSADGDWYIGRDKNRGAGVVTDVLTIDEADITPATGNTAAQVVREADAFDVIYEGAALIERFRIDDRNAARLNDADRAWVIDIHVVKNDTTAVHA